MMNLESAHAIAERARCVLAPWCDRIAIAGSIRRKKPEVGDIELVAIPTASIIRRDLWGEIVEVQRDHRFAKAVRSLGLVLKGDPSSGRYIQLHLPDGIALDLFLATPENWGLILAIRTGSADYSHRVLASGWVRAGYHSIGGMLCTRFHKVPVREEEDLFNLIGLPWAAPETRL